MNVFFSQMGSESEVAQIYNSISDGIDVESIIKDAEEPISNTNRKLIWANKVEKSMGYRPSLNAQEEHECRYCHKSIWLPKGCDVNPFKLFCNDQCDDEYHDQLENS